MYRLRLRGQALRLGLLVTLVALTLSACGSDGGGSEAAGAEGKLDRVVEIDGERGLYVRCTGAGSPIVVMEAGDETDSSQYAFAEQAVAKKMRTCLYDRAGLGRSDVASTLFTGVRGTRILGSWCSPPPMHSSVQFPRSRRS